MGRKEYGRYGKHSRRDRRKKKGGIISTVILIVAICVFAFSAFQLYKIFNGYHKGESEYDDLVKLAVTEDKGEQENGTDDQDGSRFFWILMHSDRSIRMWLHGSVLMNRR